MRRGLSFFQFNGGVILGIFLLFLFGAGLSGCMSTNQSASLSKPVICTPQVSNANIYRAALAVPTLTPNGTAPNGATGINTNLSAEQVMALLQGTPLPGLPVASAPDSYISILGTLVRETKAWSDVQTIKLDDSSTAQIVVTFISPQLIEAVYYSELSSRGYAISSPQSALNAVAAREELIFFVTVITSTNNNINTTPHTIKIPIQRMVIMNADDLEVPPLHDDHILAQPINSSFEPVFGYLTYPIAMINGMDCSWILNPNYNKKIIVTVSDILVDGVSAGTYTWVIPFSSLIKTGYFPVPQSNIVIDQNTIANSFVPPSPMTSLLISNGIPEDIFWQKYAGFLWRQVMMGIY